MYSNVHCPADMDSNNQCIMGELCRFYALDSGFAASPVMRARIAAWLNLLDTPAAKQICVI